MVEDHSPALPVERSGVAWSIGRRSVPACSAYVAMDKGLAGPDQPGISPRVGAVRGKGRAPTPGTNYLGVEISGDPINRHDGGIPGMTGVIWLLVRDSERRSSQTVGCRRTT